MRHWKKYANFSDAAHGKRLKQDLSQGGGAFWDCDCLNTPVRPDPASMPILRHQPDMPFIISMSPLIGYWA